MNNDQLLHFLQDVQANLERTLLSVNEKMSELQSPNASLGHDLHIDAPVQPADSIQHHPCAVSPDPPETTEFTSRDGCMPDLREAGRETRSKQESGWTEATTVVSPPFSFMGHRWRLSVDSPKDIKSDEEAPRPAFAPSVETTKKKAPSYGLERSVSMAGKLAVPSKTSEHLEDHLLKYTFEHHKAMTLLDRLEDLKHTLDLPTQEFNNGIRIVDAQKVEHPAGGADSLKQDQFPVVVTWKWLTKDDFAKHSCKGRALFLYRGLTNNNQLRAILLRLKSRLFFLQQRANEMVDELINDESDAWQKDEEAMKFRTLSDGNMSGVAVDTEMCKDTLRALEALLQREFKDDNGNIIARADALFQMAGCPFNEFLSIYIRDRDQALTATDRPRRHIVKATSRAVDMVDCLCGYLQDRIDNNDQLLFKLFLLLMNAATCLGQFVYYDHISIPKWKLQIKSIYERVVGGI